jgi:SAM-dependent methyltransferase
VIKNSTSYRSVVMNVLATFENYDEAAYLEANPDVARAVRAGTLRKGFDHFATYGKNENRYLRHAADLDDIRAAKMARVEPILRHDLAYERRGFKYDFLTKELRAEAHVQDTENVSQNGYDSEPVAIIEEFKDGLILDCGSGRRPAYYSNVVNYEIVDYDTTDVLGIGEVLPFNNDAFDAVLSIAVLEHVRDPFRCASELSRVLKPGGKLFCAVPFLQPFHGYPHHYYNMTSLGLRNLFDGKLAIDDIKVTGQGMPIWALTWIIRSWASGLSGGARNAFLNMPVRELARDPHYLLEAAWVKELSEEKNFELACSSYLFAHKR